MAPSSTGAARRATAPQPRPTTRRPALRVFEPAPRRSTRRHRSRGANVLAAALVVGSLLAVVVGDNLVAEGQVRLANVQQQIVNEQTAQKAMQTEVAELAAPDRLVAQAIALGSTAPAGVVDLPQVPLDVPLPTPRTTAPPAR